MGINLVPLIRLGSDQVDKATVTEHNAEAYHADEHKSKDGYYLRQRLLGASDDEMSEILIMLHLSPSKLTTKSGWMPILKRLAQRGFISLISIDEAHTVE